MQVRGSVLQDTMKVELDWDNIEWQEYTPKSHKVRRKLLITTDNFLPRWDGISRFLSEIVPRLAKDYEITLVCPDYGFVHVDGVTIEKIPLAGKSYGDYAPASLAYKRIVQLVRQADIIFNQALGPIGVCAILAAKRTRRPIVCYIHSIEWELVPKALASPSFRAPLVGITKLFAKWAYNRCAALILPSENIAEQFSWQGIRTPKRIAHLGVDVKKFRPVSDDVRRQLDIPKDAFVIGYHGRIANEKNLVTLLRAFRQLKMKNKKLLIVGDGILEIKAKLERFDDVIVTGSTDNVIPWLQAMDIYVQPSFTETTSLSVLEAMACGLPVVSSRVGFIQFYIIDRENGMFFDNASAYDLSMKLTELAKDAEMRRKLGANARKTIEKSFKWESTANEIKMILDSI